MLNNLALLFGVALVGCAFIVSFTGARYYGVPWCWTCGVRMAMTQSTCVCLAFALLALVYWPYRMAFTSCSVAGLCLALVCASILEVRRVILLYRCRRV